jgi:predicted nucleotidyltransferase
MPPCSARARGDARPDSDIDILVEIAPDVRMDVFKYVGIVHSIEDPFPVRVDVSNRIALKPHLKPTAEREAIYAFRVRQACLARHSVQPPARQRFFGSGLI